MNNLPLSVEICYEDPALLFRDLSHKSWAIFLDSADSHRQFDDTNRYSYIVFEPFEKILIKNHRHIETNEVIDRPFQYLKQVIHQYPILSDPQLPIFQGGAVGYFSYDLCHYNENIGKPSKHEALPYADMAIGLYDTVISFDHVLRKAWIVSTGFSEPILKKRKKKAEKNIKRYLDIIHQKKQRIDNTPLNLKVDLISPYDKQSYIQLVKKAQNYILEGDIFEINLSHRFEATLNLSSFNKYDLYLNMRRCNPSPFSAYLNMPDHQIFSTSPERFLSLTDGQVSARPIKGTAPRGQTAIEDQKLAESLVESEKNRSENIMIVDLMRNDLSKVCCLGSIQVTKLCGIETYPTVHHLVSVIEGKIRADKSACDLLEACFPGGSITGTPKVRAMQIIYELEPTARGPYCGSIGYIGFNGVMDTSIIIRTLLLNNNKMTYQTGGAIILDSTPEDEYEETLMKSLSIRKIFTTEENIS